MDVSWSNAKMNINTSSNVFFNIKVHFFIIHFHKSEWNHYAFISKSENMVILGAEDPHQGYGIHT